MSAIPYVSAELLEPAAIVEAIRARRGGHLLQGSDALLVELVGVIATYNMVARFLIALDVDLG